MATEFSPTDAESNQYYPSSSEFLLNKRRCCFCIPYRSSRPLGLSYWWQKLRTSFSDGFSEGSLLSRGIVTLKKVREWSERVAGPKWKTFIRRFNRNKSGGRAKFQYDPLSYALNFDEGPLQTGDSEVENEYMFRNFSSRYVAPTMNPVMPKASVDPGKDGIASSLV